MTLMSDDSPTLAHVFALSERIELNIDATSSSLLDSK